MTNMFQGFLCFCRRHFQLEQFFHKIVIIYWWSVIWAFWMPILFIEFFRHFDLFIQLFDTWYNIGQRIWLSSRMMMVMMCIRKRWRWWCRVYSISMNKFPGVRQPSVLFHIKFSFLSTYSLCINLESSSNIYMMQKYLNRI